MRECKTKQLSTRKQWHKKTIENFDILNRAKIQYLHNKAKRRQISGVSFDKKHTEFCIQSKAFPVSTVKLMRDNQVAHFVIKLKKNEFFYVLHTVDYWPFAIVSSERMSAKYFNDSQKNPMSILHFSKNSYFLTRNTIARSSSIPHTIRILIYPLQAFISTFKFVTLVWYLRTQKSALRPNASVKWAFHHRWISFHVSQLWSIVMR